MDIPIVSYEDARNYIKDGDVVFISKKKRLSASIIRFFTHSNYSHVGFAFWAEIAGTRRLMMAEAQGGAKRRIVNMSFYKGIDLDIVKAPKDWSKMAPDALDRLGEVRYGWLEALYVGFRESILKTFGWMLPEHDLPGEICSEYCARLLDMPEMHISPQGLWEELIARGNELRVQVR